MIIFSKSFKRFSLILINMTIDERRTKLVSNGLRVTPQRLAVLGAFSSLEGNPSAEMIISHIHKNHPNIASGTIYKILETLVEKEIIRKIKTDRDFVRYEVTTKIYHHLYSSDTEKIEDYFDDELDQLLTDFFANKFIQGFTIEEIKLHIKGKFKYAKVKNSHKDESPLTGAFFTSLFF